MKHEKNILKYYFSAMKQYSIKPEFQNYICTIIDEWEMKYSKNDITLPRPSPEGKGKLFLLFQTFSLITWKLLNPHFIHSKRTNKENFHFLKKNFTQWIKSARIHCHGYLLANFFYEHQRLKKLLCR
jgi:hypothetical protein